MQFANKLADIVAKNNSLLCVGLDPDINKLPTLLASNKEPLFSFNKAIIDATSDLVCSYKLNSAMYEADGSRGIDQLQKSCSYLRKHFPNIPIILDFKRGDIDNTNDYYAKFAFDYLKVDAITINPYLGKQANESFLRYKDKGIIVLCRTSNPGASEFQDLQIKGKKLYRIVAEEVMNDWNKNKNCLLVIGSPYPKELAEIRQTLGDTAIFLVPGLGTQGGKTRETVKAGINRKKEGIIINSSREVIYASSGEDFVTDARDKASKLRREINSYR